MKILARVIIGYMLIWLPTALLLPLEDILPPSSAYPYKAPPFLHMAVSVYNYLLLLVLLLFAVLVAYIFVMLVISVARWAARKPHVKWYSHLYSAALLYILLFPLIVVCGSIETVDYYVPAESVAEHVNKMDGQPRHPAGVDIIDGIWSSLESTPYWNDTPDNKSPFGRYHDSYKMILKTSHKAVKSLTLVSLKITTDKGNFYEAKEIEPWHQVDPTKSVCPLPCRISEETQEPGHYMGTFVQEFPFNSDAGEIVTTEITFEFVTDKGKKRKTLTRRWVPVRIIFETALSV